jgi:hypothetical protein
MKSVKRDETRRDEMSGVGVGVGSESGVAIGVEHGIALSPTS